MKLYKSLTVVTIGAVVAGLEIFISALPGQAVTLSTSAGQVGKVDVSTGVFTPFINSGPAFTDIAVNDAGQLYGTTFNQLYSISQKPGSSNLIGNHSANDINGLGFGNDNVLYGTGYYGGFYSVSTTTGATNLISKIPGLSSGGDIVYDPAINRFLAASLSPNNSSLFSIGVDGASTQIGNIGFANVYGLAFNNGTLYGYTKDGNQLIVNLTTGGGVLDKKVTGISGEIYGAASSNNDAKPVPEATTLVSTIAAIFAGLWIKYKRKASQSA